MNKVKSYGKYPFFSDSDLFVIGDVHGELEKLKILINKLPITANSVIVFVGDVIDQGPKSIGVLLYIKELKIKHQVYLIEGNHEHIFKRICAGTFSISGALDKKFLEEFLYYGANSVSVAEINKVLNKYDLCSVLNNTIPYWESENVIITHAPISNETWKKLNFTNWQENDYKPWVSGFPLDYLAKDDLLWEFVDDESESVSNLEKILICGHQNNWARYDEPRVFKNRIFLDCGTGYRQDKALFAVHYPSKLLFSSN